MIGQFRQQLLATSLLVGSAAVASPAFAQAAPPSSSPDTVAAAQQNAAQSAPGTAAAPQTASQPTSEIVVTGSRLARPDLEGASPVAVVGQQDIALKAASSNIENVLNDLPQVTATTSSTSNNPGGGVATVNLRGLGSARTLVLVNARRYMSYDVSQVVDLNTIPSSLIERVDVVTGGQSAIYGSDAIAGVVNFILKKNFSGVQLDSSYNITQRGDGQLFDVGLTLGTNVADNRGNFVVFAGYTKRKPTFAGERGFSSFALNDNEDGSPLVIGGSGSTPAGRVNIPGLGAATGLGCNRQTFNTNGTSRCFVTADSYNFNPINYLQVPQDRFLVSAMGSYEISDNFQPYLEAQFVNNRVNAQLAPTPITSGTPFGANGVLGPINLLVNSPFYSPAFQAALRQLDARDSTPNNGYVTAPSFNFRTVGVGPRINQDDRNAYRIVTGMKGKAIFGFDYDGYYMYSRTRNSQRQLGNVAIDKFINATSNNIFFNPTTGATSVTPQTGFVLACGSAAARASGCVPANIFGAGNISQAANNYIAVGATNLEKYNTQVASVAFTNSNLFDIGAGGIGLAFGAEWRREKGAVDPDTTLASGNVAGFNPGQPTAGAYTVREFFAETHVPLLRDSFLHRVELNGAVRRSHYSNAVKNVTSYSAGAEVAPVRDITFRGQYAKTVRGPSVNELFLGNTVSFNGNADLCGSAAALTGQLNAICRAQFTAAGAPLARIGDPTLNDASVNPLTFVGGNANLGAESAKTITVGAVLQPRFLPRFSATVDYYNIKIKGYIAGVGTQNIGTLCFVNFNQDYCNRIARDTTGEVVSFTDTLSNSGGLKTSGVDVSAGYFFPLGNFLGFDRSRLSFNFQGTRLIKNDYTPVLGLDKVISCAGKFGANCGVPTPKWRHTARATLAAGPVRLSGQWRYIGSVNDDDPDTLYFSEHFKAFSYFDATLGFDVGDHYTLNLGVANIGDKKPPLAATTQNGGNGEQSNTFPTTYDVLGRSFFVGAKLRF